MVNEVSACVEREAIANVVTAEIVGTLAATVTVVTTAEDHVVTIGETAVAIVTAHGAGQHPAEATTVAIGEPDRIRPNRRTIVARSDRRRVCTESKRNPLLSMLLIDRTLLLSLQPATPARMRTAGLM